MDEKLAQRVVNDLARHRSRNDIIQMLIGRMAFRTSSRRAEASVAVRVRSPCCETCVTESVSMRVTTSLSAAKWAWIGAGAACRIPSRVFFQSMTRRNDWMLRCVLVFIVLFLMEMGMCAVENEPRP